MIGNQLTYLEVALLQDSREPRNFTTLAIEVNKAEIGGKNKKNVSEITCQTVTKKTLHNQVSGVLKVKKLVSILVNFMSMTGVREEALKRVFNIHYHV